MRAGIVSEMHVFIRLLCPIFSPCIVEDIIPHLFKLHNLRGWRRLPFFLPLHSNQRGHFDRCFFGLTVVPLSLMVRDAHLQGTTHFLHAFHICLLKCHKPPKKQTPSVHCSVLHINSCNARFNARLHLLVEAVHAPSKSPFFKWNYYPLNGQKTEISLYKE